MTTRRATSINPSIRERASMRKTKIIATLGPSSASVEVIGQLVAAGADVFRLNCSHLDTHSLSETIALVRAAAPMTAILVDIQGPKMRYTGEERTLEQGEVASLSLESLGLEGVAGAGGLSSMEVGHRLLLDDGRIEGLISSVGAESLSVEVKRGGLLRRNKGVNLPDTRITGGTLSEKDVSDLAVCREAQVEIVAVSFVQESDDVLAVRRLLEPRQIVVAKIERPQALVNLPDICEVADGVMAARGDLGVEVPYEEIPTIQRRIGLTALAKGVISVCATEMLESMISSSRPTRAEVADVSAAVGDGYDAVMLSGETAVGQDPVGAVTAMSRICTAAEEETGLPNVFADANPAVAAVTAAATALAKRVGADSILALTFTGYSARLLAACRPACPIVAVTPDAGVARSLNLSRAVRPVTLSRDPDVGVAITEALAECRRRGLVAASDKVVICASRVSPRSDADTILFHIEQR